MLEPRDARLAALLASFPLFQCSLGRVTWNDVAMDDFVTLDCVEVGRAKRD
jgi:hypothetical protein